MKSKSVKGQDLIPARWKWLNIIDYILPIYIICTIPMFYLGLHYDIVFKGVAIMVSLVFVLKYGVPRYQGAKLFLVFFFLVFFSFIQYIYNGVPIVCYISDVSNYVGAMLFFFIGIRDDRLGRSFYEKLLYATAIVFVLGLICYILTPAWYINRYLDFYNNTESISYSGAYSENDMLTKLRFSAFFGISYPVSHFSVFAAAIAIFDIGYSKGRKKVLSIVLLIIAVISSVACMHRASMAGIAICLIMFVYFNHITHQDSINRAILLLGLLVIIGIIIYLPSMNDRMTDLFNMLTARVDDNMNLGKALDERKNTRELMTIMRFYLFGHGLGSGGPGVREYGLPGIADMQYIKMFFENGIIGAVLFIMVIAGALGRGIRNIKYYLTEVSIILFILVAMLGSNSLSIYYLIVFPFWYAVGRLYNTNYLNKVKNKEWIY